VSRPASIPVDKSDATALTRMLNLWGVTDYSTLATVIDSYKQTQIASGEDSNNFQKFQSISTTHRSIFGFDYGPKNWQFDIKLLDGRTETVVARAGTPFAAIVRIRTSNVLDDGRAYRWNNNVESVTAKIVGDNSFTPIKVSKEHFDRQTDFNTLGDAFRADSFPARYDPYATRAAGRIQNPATTRSLVNSDGSSVPNIETSFTDTEPGTKTTPTDLTASIVDSPFPSISTITVSDLNEAVNAIYS